MWKWIKFRQIELIGLAAFVIASASAVYLEAKPFLASAGNDRSRFEALAGGEVCLGLSAYSGKIILDDCLVSMSSVFGRLQAPPRRQALLSHCSSLARDLGARMPSFAYAWYVAAYAEAEAGDVEVFRAMLAKSYTVAPNEIWLAELRTELTDRFLSEIGDGNRPNSDADIRLLLQTDRGATWLAGRMLGRKGLHDRVVAIAEHMPQSVQDLLIARIAGAVRSRKSTMAVPGNGTSY